MKQLEELTKEVDGLRLHIVETDKYKTNTVVLMLKAPLSKETVAKRAILPHVLQSGTTSLPSRQKIRNQLDEMYGATLQVDVQKKGEHHIIVFRMDLANERFLQEDANVFNQGIKLLADILQDPKVEENGGFDKEILENEKRSLTQRIQSVFDDKMRYANQRVTEEMCKDEPFGLSVYGTEEEVNAINSTNLYEYYKKILEEDEVDLYIVGDIEPEEIEKAVQQTFRLQSRQMKKENMPTTTKQQSDENVVFEEQDVKQGKLHIGYRTNTTYADEDYFALQVCNGLFGGFSHSKLFINVREKESLAYYAASRYESHKGILMVMSGIEFSNYEKAVNIIKEQMKEMQSGNFTDGELEQTKAMIKNQLLETVDMSKAYIELLYHNVVSNKNRAFAEWLDGIDAVTKEDVIAVANKITLDTIYFLKGKEGA